MTDKMMMWFFENLATGKSVGGSKAEAVPVGGASVEASVTEA